MDTIRRVILPVIIIVILLAALIFRLSSCASDASEKNQAAGTSAPPSDSAAASPSPAETASPTAPYSAKEIKSIYESLGLAVVEIRDAGDYTMVHYYKPTGVPDEIISRFDWFDRQTGARELVYGWAYTDTFDIKPDKSFTVLTTGLSYIDGMLSFPELYRSGYTEIDGALHFSGTSEKYYAPILNSYTLGMERRACLTQINVTPGFMSFNFGPQQGFESEFYAGEPSIPKMDFNSDNGLCTMTLYKTTLAEGADMLAVKENSYCSFSSVAVEGDNLIIKLQLSANVSRYNVSTALSPENGLPCAIIEFTGMDYDYPAGW